jgi:signal transduction histidine kinase
LKYTNSQLIEANEQLKTNDKLQKEFINIDAHELRTPIQPILGASEIIEEQFNTDGLPQKIEITKPEIDLIYRNAKSLERLSSTLLEVVRIESQSLKLDKKVFDINEKIAHVTTDTKAATFDPSYWSKSSGNNGISITFEPMSSPIIVNADEERIAEVITNLVNNAMKFTREGSITMTSQMKDGCAIITIRDSGDGIDAEMLKNYLQSLQQSLRLEQDLDCISQRV